MPLKSMGNVPAWSIARASAQLVPAGTALFRNRLLPVPFNTESIMLHLPAENFAAGYQRDFQRFDCFVQVLEYRFDIVRLGIS